MTRKEKNIIDALKKSNEQLENFIDYSSKMRNRVMRTINSASKYGYTYIDLDTIDGARAQIYMNKEIIRKIQSRK